MHLFKRARSATARGAAANDPDTPRDSRSMNDLTVSATHNYSYSAQSIGKKIYSRLEEDTPQPTDFFQYPREPEFPSGLSPPPRYPPRHTLNTYENHSDLYTSNSLNTYSFGAAPSSPAFRVSPLDPLFLVPDEVDPDDNHLTTDMTPRPSVVGDGSRSPNSHSDDLQQSPRLPGLHASSKDVYKSETASIHTFGGSSSSLSSSYVPGPSGSNAWTSPHVFSISSSTHPSSGNDLTSSEDDDVDHVHPFSSDAEDKSSPPSPPSPVQRERVSPVYISDDDLYISDDEVDDEPNKSELPQRKGSIAIPIPSPSHDDYHEREGSVSAVRRASRSLDELVSFSSAKTSEASCGTGTNTVTPQASSSFPQSEYEIENVRKKSLPPITLSADPTSTDTFGFDASWMDRIGRTGITGFNSDEMADIVHGSPLSSYARKNSVPYIGRRHSTFSTVTVDIMLKNIHTWNIDSQKYQDQRRLWIFVKEGIDSRLAVKERPGISNLFSGRSPAAHDNVIAPFADQAYIQKERRPFEKSWKGIPLDAEESWKNGWSGKFRVMRRNTSNDPYSLQQRIHFLHVPTEDGNDCAVGDRPLMTLHRHSRVVGFTIRRSYRPKPSFNESNNATGPNDVRRQAVRIPESQTDKKAASILLAPRHVQVSYTSTKTTRKLESHGLLDENGRKNPKIMQRMEKMKKEIERERKKKAKERDKERGGVMERAAKTFSGKGKEKEKVSPCETKSLWEGVKEKNRILESWSSEKGVDVPVASSQLQAVFRLGSSEPNSAVMSSHARADPIASTSQASSTTGGTTLDIGGLTNSAEHFVGQKSDRLDQTTSIGQEDPLQRRESVTSNEEAYDEYGVDPRRRQPHRSTYREAYATLPPEVFEAAHREQLSNKFFGWSKSKASDRGGHRNYFEASYNPPWALTQPRHSAITRRDIVEDLNTSFQDVGLLPAIGEIKNINSKGKQKKARPRTPPMTNEYQFDFLAQLSDDTLYMILPLWPGETDPTSAKRYPFKPPVVPVAKRLYLLVYYKPNPAPVPPDDKSAKKRPKNTPRIQDDQYVLLNSFHISARVLSYSELQGSSNRIPDRGLTICGPLREAFESMPDLKAKGDFIICICHSRETGFEFVPEGFERMGLSQNVPNPRLMEMVTDDDSSSLDTITVPTPIGHAVMELAWLGGMALMGFHRDPQWRG